MYKRSQVYSQLVSFQLDHLFVEATVHSSLVSLQASLAPAGVIVSIYGGLGNCIGHHLEIYPVEVVRSLLADSSKPGIKLYFYSLSQPACLQ